MEIWPDSPCSQPHCLFKCRLRWLLLFTQWSKQGSGERVAGKAVKPPAKVIGWTETCEVASQNSQHTFINDIVSTFSFSGVPSVPWLCFRPCRYLQLLQNFKSFPRGLCRSTVYAYTSMCFYHTVDFISIVKLLASSPLPPPHPRSCCRIPVSWHSASNEKIFEKEKMHMPREKVYPVIYDEAYETCNCFKGKWINWKMAKNSFYIFPQCWIMNNPVLFLKCFSWFWYISPLTRPYCEDDQGSSAWWTVTFLPRCRKRDLWIWNRDLICIPVGSQERRDRGWEGHAGNLLFGYVNLFY